MIKWKSCKNSTPINGERVCCLDEYSSEIKIGTFFILDKSKKVLTVQDEDYWFREFRFWANCGDFNFPKSEGESAEDG